MKYCSSEARKIINSISERGWTVDTDDYMFIEQAVGAFWTQQIVDIVNKVGRKTESPDSVWAYFSKPIWSMLPARLAASRVPSIYVDPEDPNVSRIYNTICSNLLLLDFNLTELGLLTNEIPTLVGDNISMLSSAIAAAKRGGARGIYYLHGILKREAAAKAGKIREIQEQAALPDSRWEPDPNIEPLDVVERRLLADAWLASQNDIQITRSLNEQT